MFRRASLFRSSPGKKSAEMHDLKIHLFGKFSVSSDGRVLERLEASKAQELLCYLLVNRARPHPRETLAALLWGDSPTEKSKKYLRQALWHLQSVLDPQPAAGSCERAPVLCAEHDWVRLNAGANVWLDVDSFERAFALARGERGAQLSAGVRDELDAAVELYRGDLLEGWYQDWCLFERERLQNMYLLMLDKLLGYCEAHGECEAGQRYGALILRHDRARESTHRQLMRLHSRAGDRTAALRQYERCAAALREELGVEPDRRTAELRRQIRSDQLPPRPAEANTADGVGAPRATEPAADQQTEAAAQVSLPEVLGRLRQLQQVVADAQTRIQQDIQSLELMLKQRASRALRRQP